MALFTKNIFALRDLSLNFLPKIFLILYARIGKANNPKIVKFLIANQPKTLQTMAKTKYVKEKRLRFDIKTAIKLKIRILKTISYRIKFGLLTIPNF